MVRSHYTSLNFGMTSMLVPDERIVTTTCFFHVGGFYTGIYSLCAHQYFFHMFGPGFTLEHIFKTIADKRPKQVSYYSTLYYYVTMYLYT